MSESGDRRGEGNSLPLRPAARLIVLAPDERILLLRDSDPEDPRSQWWITPGGGLEPGEDARAAALRELFEETGLHPSSLTGPVGSHSFELQWQGRRMRQVESFFLATVSSTEVLTERWSETERHSLQGHRWWTRAELATTEQIVRPSHLARLLEDAAEAQRTSPPRG